MEAREKLDEYLRKEVHRISASAIFDRLTRQCTAGKIKEIKEKIKGGEIEYLHQGIEYVKNSILEKREFMAYLVPTVVSYEKARSFLFSNEKEPTEEDVYNWLYLLLTGVHGVSQRNLFVVNLLNVSEEVKDRFFMELISDKVFVPKDRGIDLKRLSDICDGPMPFTGEYTFAFLYLNYFMNFCRRLPKEPKMFEKWGLTDLLEKSGVTNETTLLTIEIPSRGEKSKIYFVPKVAEFAIKWYSEFFLDPNIKYPQLGKFISSLYVIHRQYREFSAGLLNKFLYYLLHGEVNGELLEKLIRLKVGVMEAGEVRPISEARYFFSKLVSS